MFQFALAVAALSHLAHVSTSVVAYDVKPFKVDIGADKVQRMQSRIRDTSLPARPQFVGSDDFELGVTATYLKDLQSLWTSDEFNWEKEQANINEYDQFTVEIEGIDLHFVHQKSSDPNAVPLIMAHGWPGVFSSFTLILKIVSKSSLGSIHEYLPTVTPLTSFNGTSTSFHVVIPSLPGFTFSSAPPINWTNDDTARIFNTLMVDVLGYKTYMTFGSDWGAIITYSSYVNYTESVKASMFALLPFVPPTLEEVREANVTLSEFEEAVMEISERFLATGSAYFQEFQTKPNTAGLSLYDSPIGQLAWIGQLYKALSDPRAGTGPSQLTNTTLLTSVSLYYLTESYLSALWIYHTGVWRSSYELGYPKPTTPMGFSAYRYNLGWPRAYVEKVGNVTFYKEHEFGGHFPGLDNPAAVVDDLRTFAAENY